MFFLHALATKRKQLQEQGDIRGLKALPQVTVFEKTSSPGGVWKSNRKDGSTNMYEGLWTNGHKDGMEFFDYTYEDHFKTPQPVYLPRQQILEYIMKRVTQHEDIFQHVRFNTAVTSVSYDENIEKFIIKTQRGDDEEGGMVETQYFDYCIWASGLNGKPKMIPSIMDNLSNYKGNIVHSSEMSKLDGSSVKGKNILLVGGAYSAEDLALAFIKLGVEKIFITSRNAEDLVHYTTAWPGNKVHIIEESVPCGAYDGHTVEICRSTASAEVGEGKSEVLEKYEEHEDISIIVFCTGYMGNLDFLDRELLPCAYNYDNCEDFNLDFRDWKMRRNALTDVLGDVEVSNDVYPEVPREILLADNPNMMFIHEIGSYPLLEIDVAAWLCVAYITGDAVVPSGEQIMEDLRLTMSALMHDSEFRYEIDKNYRSAIDSTMSFDFRFLEEDVQIQYFKEECSLPLYLLAQDMEKGQLSSSIRYHL